MKRKINEEINEDREREGEREMEVSAASGANWQTENALLMHYIYTSITAIPPIRFTQTIIWPHINLCALTQAHSFCTQKVLKTQEIVQ